MKRFVAAISVFTSVLFFSGAVMAAGAQQAKLWPFWDKEVSRNTQTIDHRTWNLLLKKYVVANHPSEINRFRYGDVKKSDRKALKKYIKALSKMDPRDYRKAEQKAYWINLYNALVVKQVLDNYPVENITDIGRKGERGPWDEKIIKIEGKKLSLNDIEHRILRPIWKDHKIHFALVDGSLGAPNLQPRAYTTRNMRSMLKNAAREYINHPRGLQFEKGRMRASRVFADHQSDFAKNRAGLLKLFAYYVDDRKALYLLGFQGDIEYHSDWALNAP